MQGWSTVADSAGSRETVPREKRLRWDEKAARRTRAAFDYLED
uniref:Uncharacterized protein n=1 Tax=Faecalibaculum rodentium TaxID=1702221 RepID=A0A140DY85_9FIRM|nr:hypothetical protein AALO17_24780 [Faecalibaculum rodentium]